MADDSCGDSKQPRRLRYSSDFLRTIASNFCKDIPRRLRRDLQYFRIWKRCNLEHQNTIPVRISSRRRKFDNCPSRERSNLRRVSKADRHVMFRREYSLSFGYLNIRSITNKIDGLLDVRRDFSLQLLLLVETWHDEECALFNRLRSDGFRVVDRPRPRQRQDTLRTNHGGVAIISSPGVRLFALQLQFEPTTFEFICARVTSGSLSNVIALIYRTGPVTSCFFSELTDLLERISVYSEAIYLVGDINIHMERQNETTTKQLCDLLSSFGLSNRVSLPTHNLGGTLDIVATREDTITTDITVNDVQLSDHFMIRWSSSLLQSPPTYRTTIGRQWSRLNLANFRYQLQMSSKLCSPDSWRSLSIDQLTALYETELSAILDLLLPLKAFKIRSRPSDPWFDAECRQAKRKVRRCERMLHEPSGVHTASITSALAEWKNAIHNYRLLLRRKRECFWFRKISESSRDPRRLWQNVNCLLGRSRLPASCFDGSAFLDAFSSKVQRIRSSVSSALPPTFRPLSSRSCLENFSSVSISTVYSCIMSLRNKFCALDPIPTSLLKDSADLLAPFLTYLINESLSTGLVPASFKHALVTPVCKKRRSPEDITSYRPISNIPTIAKLLERLVAFQLNSYLAAHQLRPKLQSAYRVFHSAETAMLKVSSDLLSQSDSGKIGLLTLLDVSSAFDTIDHDTLITRLRISYGIKDTALAWFSAYLTGRTQAVKTPSSLSKIDELSCGVPQGSALGPILFSLYTADLVGLVSDHDLVPHLYADDLQIYGFCALSCSQSLLNKMVTCISDVAVWLSSNSLLLNKAKTEIMWFSSARRRHLLPSQPFPISDVSIRPASCVCSLGIFVDNDLSFKTQVTKTVSGCFSSLRLIRSIRHSISQTVLRSLLTSLVFSRLDYGSVILAGLPKIQQRRLQAVLNASARMLRSPELGISLAPIMKDIGWLSFPDRIAYNTSCLIHRCLHGKGPSYLTESLHLASENSHKRKLRYSGSLSLLVPPTAHKTLGDRAWSAAAPRTWNRIPQKIRDIVNFKSFTKALKVHYLNRST